MFSAYFDASGKKEESNIAVAGFIAQSQAWTEWEKYWLQRLAIDGLGYFHRREISRLGHAKAGELILDLSKIILDHVAVKVGCFVRNAAIRELFPGEAAREYRMHAYSITGRTCVARIREWTRSWGGPWPEFVFESGDEGFDYLHKLMVTQGYPQPILKPKKNRVDRKSGLEIKAAVPLQAADLLAYEIFKRGRLLAGRGYGLAEEEIRINPYLDRVSGDWGEVDQGRLRFFRTGLDHVKSVSNDGPDILPVDFKVDVKKGEDSF